MADRPLEPSTTRRGSARPKARSYHYQADGRYRPSATICQKSCSILELNPLLGRRLVFHQRYLISRDRNVVVWRKSEVTSDAFEAFRIVELLLKRRRRRRLGLGDDLPSIMMLS